MNPTATRVRHPHPHRAAGRACRAHAAAALLLAGAFLAPSTQGDAIAQAYPAKPIRMVVPFAPGGNTDIIARVIAPRMAESLGQPVIIENRGGAGGVIGSEVVARAAPDGYTLLMVSAAHVINPAMVKKLPFDSIKDFQPISLVADVPTALIVHPSLPVRNVKELVALGRKRPDQVNYSTAGRGTVGHLSGELLNAAAKVRFVHIPYKGAGPALTDLIAGQVEFQFASLPAVVQFVRAGKVRLIAQTGAKRSGAAPDVPTMEESGLPGFIVSSGFGILGPAGTPRPVVDRVNAAIRAALGSADVKKVFAEQGAEPVGSTPEEYEAFNRNEIARWQKAAREANIQPE
ncbi:MAG: Bug family tripartite tricarboxylate transporter substrate binding protein [bacterium]|nr:tripartite tricarboxylate transporter substrate binding protein [Betaproteobacteria bacterium]